jgi:protein pelota
MKYELKDNKGKLLGIFIEREEDLWLLYTLLRKGDIVTMRTTRDVSIGEGEESKRIPMVLSIIVSTMEFQPFTNRLRIRGLIVEGPEKYGLRGHYHSFNIEPGSYIEVYREAGWTHRDIRRLEKYAVSTPRLLVISIDDDEIAVAEYSFLGLRIISSMSLPNVGKIYEVSVDERLGRLKEEINNILSIMQRGNYRTILLIGPSLWVEQFKELLEDQTRKMKIDLKIEIRPYGGLKGLKDVESSGLLHKLLGTTVLQSANQALEIALQRLSNNQRTVAIGLFEVKKAAEQKAIEKLVILDEYLSTFDSSQREEIEFILESTDAHGGEIIIVPSTTNVAEKLRGLGGVVGLLRFELYEH